jgi:hypothetical protein
MCSSAYLHCIHTNLDRVTGIGGCKPCISLQSHTAVLLQTWACRIVGCLYFQGIPNWRRMRYTSAHRICKPLCAHSQILQQRIGMDNTTKDSNLICTHCGKPFYRHPAIIEKRRSRLAFCSRECTSRYRSASQGPRRVLANRLRVDHPDWSQGRIAREVGGSKQLVNVRFSKDIVGQAQRYAQERYQREDQTQDISVSTD